MTSSSPLNNNAHYIESYRKKNYSSPYVNNKLSENSQKIISQNNQKKDSYPYYFQYNNSINVDFFNYKRHYNYNQNNSQIIYRNNKDNNLIWYENFKNSNFYKTGNGIDLNITKKGKENKEINNKYFLQNEIDEIVNSFKVINNKSSSMPYLIKNKYAELF